ncbi:hypothetical protein H261_09722 [Paramagnetospirillum caucaseum]|uniref:Lipoprotein n=1 Tax=Paramagnetospirillum caucaseum TaxID=1244869 RepID=M3ABP8_9PROT|nr:hypothetical protein [Paramagnetospirillum caucaseum]EME70203.1 hypothetical protein H261_09722 [Paramagnetospirillum caucaseum]
MRKLVIASLAILSACATPSTYELKWRAERNFDKFADGPTCRVSIWGNWSGSLFPHQFAGMIYPVVEMRGDLVLVGAKSVPMGNAMAQFQMPVGDIQLRIDGNKAWTVAAINTPSLAPEGNSKEIGAQKVANSASPSPYMDPKAMAEMTQNMMSTYRSSMSPITATSGDAAKDILRQMATGRTILFRQINGNAAGKTFEYSLETFNSAMAACSS